MLTADRLRQIMSYDPETGGAGRNQPLKKPIPATALLVTQSALDYPELAATVGRGRDRRYGLGIDRGSD